MHVEKGVELSLNLFDSVDRDGDKRRDLLLVLCVHFYKDLQTVQERKIIIIVFI